jgi:superfamily I DNA/RNA helicase
LYEIFNGQQIRLVDYSDLGEQVNGIHFIEATVVEPETGRPKRVKMFRDLLFRKEPNLSLVEDSEIMKDFAIRMRKEGIREKTEAYLQRFLQDSRVNALRVKFGYAMTCHKAQGGEWKNVFLNFEPALENLNREMQYRWLYTALTRARKNLFVPEHPFTY